ncbi:adenine deaminase C-terminal domain-containing protein [Pectinatus frisingensis]|uniref:adenine deaminase C-terminal domain-containing protein n=1 Tax=Pectinatus frisingensis TaxID=865 RepID=UPI0018C4FDB7|nr:adenine deaminase C-terminal domain-containing protein [Pectinatus frisingensis]
MNINLYLKNAHVFNVYLKKFIYANIAISGNQFLYIGAEKTPTVPDKIIDLQGKYVVPGMIDCHMHIESSMAAPRTFMKGSVKNGVTTLIAEPHEIANVFGLEGIRAMAETLKAGPADVYIAIPSCVPSTNEMLETTGAVIDSATVKEMMRMDHVICLGEVMNGHDLLKGPDTRTSRLVKQVRAERPDFPLEGHLPRFLGWDLAQILFSGVGSDHTDQSLDTVKERIANGCFIQLQEKTLRSDIIRYLIDNNLFEHFAIVTDDTMPDAFIERGTLNFLVKKAMKLGMTPEQAIYAVTYTPACHMGLRDKGSIAPGKIADFAIIDDPCNFNILRTYCAGKEVYNHDTVEREKTDTSFPKHFYHSVHVPLLQEDSFCLSYNVAGNTKVRCRLLVVSRDTTFVKESTVELPVRNHQIDWENSPYNLAVVIERHGKNGGRGYALVGGSCLKRGAAATTYAHDHHNLLVIGQNKKDMTIAANTIIKNQGGYVAVLNDKIEAFAPLPIAGILSDQPLPVLGGQIKQVRQSLEQLGYEHNNVIMSLSTLSLPVSPFFKLTDRGIIDVQRQKIVPLMV